MTGTHRRHWRFLNRNWTNGLAAT